MRWIRKPHCATRTAATPKRNTYWTNRMLSVCLYANTLLSNLYCQPPKTDCKQPEKLESKWEREQNLLDIEDIVEDTVILCYVILCYKTTFSTMKNNFFIFPYFFFSYFLFYNILHTTFTVIYLSIQKMFIFGGICMCGVKSINNCTITYGA